MSENTTEVETVEAVEAAVVTVETPSKRVGQIDTYMPRSTFAEKRAIANALTSATKVEHDDPKLSVIGKPLKLVNFIVQTVEIDDKEKGVKVVQDRVILLTADGKAYDAISGPIVDALTGFVGIFGEPSEWDEPLPVQINKARSRNGYWFFDIVIL